MNNKLHKIILISSSIFIFFGLAVSINVTTASAHQSGCHRWHSCPSDSGSYTCGDTGYSNYCGGYTAPTPNYYQQGQTNGKDHANIKNRDYILSQAQTAGSTEGYNDGKFNRPKDSSVPLANICYDKVKFDTAQNYTYESSFQSSYTTACLSIYGEQYVKGYNEAYETGVKARPVETASTDNPVASSSGNNDTGNSSGWLWVGGIGAFYGGIYSLGYVVDNWSRFIKWLKV